MVLWFWPLRDQPFNLKAWLCFSIKPDFSHPKQKSYFSIWKISNFCLNFAKVFCWKLQGQIFFASFRLGFCFFMKSWNVVRCTIRVSSFCEILFAFLQQILDFQLTQNSTHLVDYYPSNIPSNFLSNGFVVSDKDIFFSCCPILNMSCSGGHLRFPIHTKIEIF